MLVSNFEVIIFPREKRTYQETTYELLITNLEDIDIEFLIEIHTGAYGLRYGSANVADLFIELINGDNVSEPGIQKRDNEFVRPIYFLLASKITALIKISHPINVQLRGYITLRVPPVRNRSHYLITTQQSTPVKVLLAASRQDFCRSFVEDIIDENRTPVYKTFINSWLSRQCIELASGKALNEIEPEGISLITKVADALEHLQLSDDLQQRMLQETAAREADNYRE